MKKKIWIWNHYATNTFIDRAGRHYWFAQNLFKQGYEPTIFCASTIHNSNESVDTLNKKFLPDSIDAIPYVFIHTPGYKGNGIKRVANMISFYKKLFPVAKEYGKINGKPDVIIASSVHPLTLVAGIKIAKKFKVPCICEVRDLWPESIVEFGNLKRNSIAANLLYKGEKWIYKKADKLIFTIEGGAEYIIDNKWDKDQGGPIDMSKVNYINNGIDLVAYDRNIEKDPYSDIDIDNPNVFKVVYAGSIRKANNLGLILDAAKYVQKNSKNNIKFLIFGDGDEKEQLQKRCIDEGISNVTFKGKVAKKYIPHILSKSNLNILHYSNHGIWKYGGSQNKNFEYLASGKPILSTVSMGYDIIERYNAGISLTTQTAESIGQAIISVAQMEASKYKELSENARKAARDYDFKTLTEKLIAIIEEA